MQQFKVVNSNGKITCDPSTVDIIINGQGIGRYIVREGKETGIVEIKDNGYMVHLKDKWTHTDRIDESSTDLRVKQLITRTLELQMNCEYDLFLSSEYEDLPDVHYIDKIQPKQEAFKPTMNKKRKLECWFCMSSSTFDKSLVIQICSLFYITAAKGPLSTTHGLIIPIDHMELLDLQDNYGSEFNQMVVHIYEHYKQNGLHCLFWITKKQLSSDRLHDYISFIGVDDEFIKKLPKFQLGDFTLNFERDNTVVFVYSDNMMKSILNPRFFDLLIHLFSNTKDWKSRQNLTLQQHCIDFLFTISPLY